MIRFSSSEIPLNKVWKTNKPKFVKVAQTDIMSQEEAIAKFMPLIEANGEDYEKFTQIKARPANPGEVIETITSDGKETQNTAQPGDYVVSNLGGSGEEYILTADKLSKRYKEVGNGIYQAIGECRGFEYNGPETVFIASWGEQMILKPGDMIVTPLPQQNEVYRIARKEFQSTYKLKENR